MCARDLLCDAADIHADLGAVRVDVEMVRAEDDARVDGRSESRDGNDRAAVCGLRGVVNFFVNYEIMVERGGQT